MYFIMLFFAIIRNIAKLEKSVENSLTLSCINHAKQFTLVFKLTTVN